MTFIDNEQFTKWVEDKLGNVVFEKRNTYSGTRIKVNPGRMAKMWRWYHKHMESTARYFGTSTHKEESKSIKSKGWTVIEIPAKEYVTKSHLFFEIAQGLNREIPQLSHKTQISPNGDYPHCIMGHQMPRRELYKFDAEISPIVIAIEYSTYETEWKEYVFQIESGRNYYEADRYYFAMAYDALNDCLYVKYLS